MSSESRAPQGAIEALGAVLGRAARDAFAEVMDPELGSRLLGALERCAAELEVPEPWSDQLGRLRGELGEFDGCGRHDRSRIVATALRVQLALQVHARPRIRRVRPGPRKPVDDDPLALEWLPRVGPGTAERLRAAGIADALALVQLLPIGYEDRRTVLELDDPAEGTVARRGRVRSFRSSRFRGRYMATAELEGGADGSARAQLRWFHPVGGLADKMLQGAEVVVVGEVRDYKGKRSIVHPEVWPGDGFVPGLKVRYPAVEGVSQGVLARLCAAALERTATLPQRLEWMPEAVARAHDLPGKREALEALHRPSPELGPEAVRDLIDRRSSAHRRIAFEELFLVQLRLLLRRARWKGQACAFGLAPDAELDAERLRGCVPFSPTAAQWRAIREVQADLRSGRPMLRLLQGDVGSGKTLVAFAGALMVAAEGGQVAFMAPTEILAEQHLRTLAPWCASAGLKPALLTGTTPKAERRSLLALLAGGALDVLIGTHALLVQDVTFADLALAVVDEQHRFGVEQRARLRGRGGGAVHLLAMTATPIPRSLALVAHGELDVSVLDELPPGRRPVKTELFAGKSALERARARLAAAVGAGERAFVVCPLVEASEALSVTHVEESAASLRALVPGRRVEVLHGRMGTRDKHRIMEAFREGTIEVLVATTVIEVGVDVPEARVMLVEHAERFGLAQIHQLRGRVGRGQAESTCLLHTASSASSDAGRRLQVLVDTHDGFEVAERDLEQRGPGAIFGTRQAGAPPIPYAVAAGEGTRLLVQAREAAQRLLDEDPELASAPRLRAELERRTAGEPVYSGDAG